MTDFPIIFVQVSLKKQYNSQTRYKGENCIPSAAPYQLSVSFSHKILSRYQYDIYHQSWLMTKQLIQGHLDDGNGTEVIIGQEGGFAAAIVGLMAREKILFDTEVPEQIVVLDPKLGMVDKQYVKLLQRYKDLLQNSGSATQEVCSFRAHLHIASKMPLLCQQLVERLRRNCNR